MTKRSAVRGTGKGLRDEDYVALASFRLALRSFLSFSEEAARAAGLTAQQHQAILAIRGLAPSQGMSINDLAERLIVKPQSAVELADRLELAGLVNRSRASDDRRRVHLRLTPKAEEILADLSTAHLEQIRREAPHLIKLLAAMSK